MLFVVQCRSTSALTVVCTKDTPKHPHGGAAIIINKEKRHLGMWPNAEEAARAYDCMAVQHFGAKAILNFPLYRDVAPFLALENMKVANRREEEEHRLAERQLRGSNPRLPSQAWRR